MKDRAPKRRVMRHPEMGAGRRGIVADGQARARAAAEPRIRKEVNGKYAEELGRAGLFRRMAIRIRIEREVRRRLREVAPDGAHYGVHP